MNRMSYFICCYCMHLCSYICGAEWSLWTGWDAAESYPPRPARTCRPETCQRSK